MSLAISNRGTSSPISTRIELLGFPDELLIRIIYLAHEYSSCSLTCKHFNRITRDVTIQSRLTPVSWRVAIKQVALHLSISKARGSMMCSIFDKLDQGLVKSMDDNCAWDLAKTISILGNVSLHGMRLDKLLAKELASAKTVPSSFLRHQGLHRLFRHFSPNSRMQLDCRRPTMLSETRVDKKETSKTGPFIDLNLTPALLDSSSSSEPSLNSRETEINLGIVSEGITSKFQARIVDNRQAFSVTVFSSIVANLNEYKGKITLCLSLDYNEAFEVLLANEWNLYSNIYSIKIFGEVKSQEQISHLITLIEKTPNLTELYCGEASFFQKGISDFVIDFPNLPVLKELYLSNCNLTSDDLKVLLSKLKNPCRIELLYLCNNAICDESIPIILDFCAENLHLSEVTLHNNLFSELGKNDLVSRLSLCSHLESYTVLS